jgi:hypothetical protein
MVKTLTAALAVALIAAPVVASAESGRDMAGNEVQFTTPFRYGGDNTGAYAGGKIGTGAKDPAVCGTFSSDKCSITYVKGK